MPEAKEKFLQDNTELEHLIKLLDDEDENIFSNVRERFLAYGNSSADFLNKYLNDENIVIKKRASEIISTINFEKVENNFKSLLLDNENNFLEEAIFYIASFGYPGIDKKNYIGKLDQMSFDIESQLLRKKINRNSLSSIEILNTINNYLFIEKGFKGEMDKYYNPDNSYINKVLDNKKGIPISLSIIYLLIAKRLNLPVSGINLPGHFILRYSKDEDEFFIDPFNKGVVISMKEAREFVKKLGMSKEDFENIPYLKAATEKEIILRVLRNLVGVYQKENDNIKSNQLEKLMLSLA